MDNRPFVVRSSLMMVYYRRESLSAPRAKKKIYMYSTPYIYSIHIKKLHAAVTLLGQLTTSLKITSFFLIIRSAKLRDDESYVWTVV